MVLRVVLFFASIFIMLWIMYKIRKSKAKIEDSVFCNYTMADVWQAAREGGIMGVL